MFTELLAALLVTISIPVTGLLVFAIVRWGPDAKQMLIGIQKGIRFAQRRRGAEKA